LKHGSAKNWLTPARCFLVRGLSFLVLYWGADQHSPSEHLIPFEEKIEDGRRRPEGVIFLLVSADGDGDAPIGARS
jgi:hypothetical protein